MIRTFFFMILPVSLRGGGEFGEAWRRAGMLGNKQNVSTILSARRSG